MAKDSHFTSTNQTNLLNNSHPQPSDDARNLNYQSLAKALNFNIPIMSEIIYWKAVVLAAIRALELEDFISTSKLPPT